MQRHRRRGHTIAALCALVWLAACSGSGPTPPGTPAESGSAEPHIQLPRTVVSAKSPRDLAAELELARGFFLALRFEDAARAFDRLLPAAEGTDLAAPALFNSGLAYEGMGQLETAAERYRELGRRHPQAEVSRGGLLRLTRVLGYLERWAELGEAADTALGRKDLEALDRVEGFGAKALSLVERGQVDDAERMVNRARDIIEQHRFGEASVPPLQLAQVAFALGEIRRARSEQIQLVPVPPNFPEVLEARCQGLLEAQDAYAESMRSRDAHWSAMSGYRIGQLYQQLHREAMQIPPPDSANNLRQKQLFEAAMRLRYRILLEKGLKMMEATVRMGERTGESSYWVARAREAQRDLERALGDEKAALGKMPFAEDDVRAALELLKGKPDPSPPKKP
ncbi:MAG: hypothetical protein HY744_05720 [Deltaproteobacteria bacterium]|nr:hypothetical protein [Deltaproteobacteria bacterium]